MNLNDVNIDLLFEDPVDKKLLSHVKETLFTRLSQLDTKLKIGLPKDEYAKCLTSYNALNAAFCLINDLDKE